MPLFTVGLIKIKRLSVKITFTKTKGPDFYTTLNKRVEDFFIKGQISKKGNGLMLLMLIFFPTIYIADHIARLK